MSIRYRSSFSNSTRKSSIPLKKFKSNHMKCIAGFPVHAGFHQTNVENTSNLPTNKRTYGLIKTKSAFTPFPRPNSALDENLVRLRLEAESLKRDIPTMRESLLSSGESISYHSDQELDADDSVNDNSSIEGRRTIMLQNMRSTSNLSFNLRRRLFDEAEFTIAKGKKLGDEFHKETELFTGTETNDVPLKSHGSVISYFYDIERAFRSFDVKISKGFDL